MRRYSPHLLSFFVGYISLSQEILWVRIYGFANHSLPQAFGVVVVCYLVGIAFGADIGKRFCSGARDLWRLSGAALLVSILIDATCFNLIVLPAFLAPEVALFAVPLLIVLVAGSKAVLFPIAHHLGTIAESGEVGRSMSKVYLCNILGSTAGPLFTGLFLLDFLSTQQCICLLLGLSGLVSFFCFFRAEQETGTRVGQGGARPLGVRSGPFASLGLTIAAVICLFALREGLYSRLGDKRGGVGPAKVIEAKNGVVSLYGNVSGASDSDDAVLGGNVYDGRTNLDLLKNTNLIDRAVILEAVQPHPKHVLVIGLSIGTWLTLVDTFPGVESIDVVEINEGYLKAIQYYPEQDRTLHDPRVHVFIDDGHRWLTAHPDTRYDLVVMNNTYYWRNFSSNLLSKEFLAEVSDHMSRGAVLTFNSTESPDVLKTASAVFKFARRRKSFILASDHDFTRDLHAQDSFNRVFSLRLDGRRIFPESTEKRLQGYIDEPLIAPDEEEKRAGRPLEIITQDNMLTEYKYGKALFTPIVQHLCRKLDDYIVGFGKPHGPFDLELRLPTRNLGQYEPLLVVPNRDGGAVVVIVHYADSSHIRLGYFQTGMIHKFTDTIETNYAKPHVLIVSLGSILPPYTDTNAYRGWSKGAIDASRQEIVLSWDGQKVFQYALDFGERDDWYRPIVGSNQIVQGVSQPSFTGKVLGQKRDPLIPPAF